VPGGRQTLNQERERFDQFVGFASDDNASPGLSTRSGSRQINQTTGNRNRWRYMDSKSFLASLEPFKTKYREQAGSSLLTLRAEGKPDDDAIVCKVETGRGLAIAGLHSAVGGSGRELCSGDMLLEALVACAGISLKAAATSLDIEISSATVSAEGDIDLRGTLGLAAEVPVGFKEIRLRFDVKANASKEKLDEMLEITERYCVVLDTLRCNPKLVVGLNTL